MTEAVYRLHSYFDSLSEALQDSSIWAAFARDQWSLTFDPDDPGPPVAAKAAIIAFNFVVGLLAAGGGVAGALGPAVWGAAESSFSTFVDKHKNEFFPKTADLGAASGDLVMVTAKALANIDDVLLRGQVFSQTGNLTVDDFESPSDLTVSSFDSTGDIRGFLRGGYWVDFGGLTG